MFKYHVYYIYIYIYKCMFYIDVTIVSLASSVWKWAQLVLSVSKEGAVTISSRSTNKWTRRHEDHVAQRRDDSDEHTKTVTLLIDWSSLFPAEHWSV